MSTQTLLGPFTATEPEPPAASAGVVAVLQVETVHADGTAELRLLELRTCRACDGTGLVAPDAFGDWQSWESWVADVEAWERDEGLDPATCGSAIRSGMLRPMACPVCGGGA